MNCPDCEHQMLAKQWITGHWLGDYALFEILFWLLISPLFLFGIFGLLLFAFIVLMVVILSWGKIWYCCPVCRYEIVVKK